jgi:hypothetical protein
MSVLTGIGQAFLYTGLVALAYAAFTSLALTNVKRWRPIAACAGGMALAAGVAAFQILETLRVQRRSIRHELTYEIFSGGGFSPLQSLKAFFAPYHNINWEATPYVSSLAALMAVVAVVTALRAPLSHRRILFWAGMALLACLLMMGNHTPLYRLAFHVPVFNRFRLPGRHTFEWSFAVSVLGAFGFDALRGLLARKSEAVKQRRNVVICLILLCGIIVIGTGWWMASGLRFAAGETLLITGQWVTQSESAWLMWKLSFTLLVMLAVCWHCSKLGAPNWRGALLAATIASACFLEGFMLVSAWWFPFAKPAGYFQTVSAPTKFLKNHPPEQNRIYTSAVHHFPPNRPLAEPHNLSAIRGFHNAAGYEPLMMEKYSRAFEGRWSFYTPWFAAPTDPQLLSPHWQVLDILNTRFMVEFSASMKETIEKDGVAFAARDIAMTLAPKASATVTGSASAVDSLSLVSTLANSGQLAQGETFAKLSIHTTDGHIIERELKAGVDSAEWAHERADVKPLISHDLAPVFDTRPGYEQNSFPAYRYWSRVELGEKSAVDRIEITNTAEHASFMLTKAALYDSSMRQAMLLTQRLPDHWRKVYDYDNVQIYENQRALPRVWLAPKAEAVSSDEALRRIRGQSDQSFDPRSVAMLEAPRDELRELTASELGSDAGARIVSYEPNRQVIQTKSDRPSVLVASEINYPGWRATIDGKQANIYAADYLLRGLILPAGEHRVEMRYTAPAARNGAIISLLSVLTIVALLVKARKAYE